MSVSSSRHASLIAATAGILLALVPAASAQTGTPPPSPALNATITDPQPALVNVTFTTSLGPVVIALEKERAPKTVANFLRYVDGKRFDGIGFYRAFNYGADGGVVQAGIRQTIKPLFPPVAHEPTSQTGLHHSAGTISMARMAPGSAQADFFILLSDIPAFDADPAAPGDNQGFAAFGHVIEGMDILKQVLAAPRSPTAGDGIMKGQMLDPPIKIISVRRTP